jgi:YbgC/YbaW family acyl-CoA thioester hydrolase
MTDARGAYRFLERLRVRWAEVDMQKVVFNGHYLMYVDTALGAYWRALALPYEETIATLGGDLFMRKAALEYHAPARYEEVLDVGIRFVGVGTTSLRFAAGVFRGEELLVQGELVYVWTSAPAAGTAQRPQPVPPALVAAFQAHADGQPVVEVEVGGWEALGSDAHAIHTAVFVEEQGIDPAIEADALDAGAVHAVARNRLGLAVGTGRLLEGAGAGGMPARIGRMAVRRDLRGGQVGRAVLEALMRHAGARGDAEVMLYAQVSASAFYLRAGFQPRGPQFHEAGIAHVEMRRAPRGLVAVRAAGIRRLRCRQPARSRAGRRTGPGGSST